MPSPKTQQSSPGLPLPLVKPKVVSKDEEKLAAVKKYVDGIRDIAGPAGDAALRLFAEGSGVDFKLTNEELVSEMRPKGDKGLYIDGKPIGGKDTIELLRGYLKSFYKLEDKKK